MKNKEPSRLAVASYLLAGAMLQEALLSSYRGFPLTFPSIFLAIETGLTRGRGALSYRVVSKQPCVGQQDRDLVIGPLQQTP